jgi:hypothetical protein
MCRERVSQIGFLKERGFSHKQVASVYCLERGGLAYFRYWEIYPCRRKYHSARPSCVIALTKS